MAEIKAPSEKIEEKLNRSQRRRKNKSPHHNVFTKKYKSPESREKAWALFLGIKEYTEARKQFKKTIKEIKENKQKEKLKRLGII